MTLGIAIPLFFLIVATGELAVFRRLHENGVIPAHTAKYLMIASFSLPIITYVILAFIVPDVGATEVW